MIALAVIFACHVTGIIDGDTFVCEGGQHVRLWGIDAPERYTPTGPASTRALAALVAGKTLACEPKGRSYQRIVALCRLNGSDVAGGRWRMRPDGSPITFVEDDADAAMIREANAWYSGPQIAEFSPPP